MTTKLHALIGAECKLESTSATLREYVEELAPAAVGACHVTCSDESERECAEAFRRWFAGRLLPELKPADRAVFRTVNLGARYEWGAVRVAEEHYAVPNISAHGFNLMLVKINSHVAVRDLPEGAEYGWLDRYGCRSACCGALTSLMEGSQLPAARELEGLFALDGRDRVGTLIDGGRVPIERRALLAAAVNARLQARRAAADVEEHRPRSPAVFLVVPCVTINRPGPDTELVVGRYEIDWTGDAPISRYHGLGDDPAAYRVTHQRRRVLIEDDQWS
ncbi:MAG: hypothetical protein KKA28_00275 [Planctomycetes bacterium]|nr:hypothetical protein [Planctomycetota bacterium]MCG2683323.1 hypothetical protein [Planctomycetales bacterium]